MAVLEDPNHVAVDEDGRPDERSGSRMRPSRKMNGTGADRASAHDFCRDSRGGYPQFASFSAAGALPAALRIRRMGTELSAYIGLLLESFVRQRGYVPEEAVAVRSTEELAFSLRARTQNLGADARWRAWSDGKRVWFIVAQWLREPWQQAHEIVLRMTFYDHDGAPAASGAWSCLPSGQWVLQEVVADADEYGRTQ